MGTVLLLTLLPFASGLGIGVICGLHMAPAQPRDSRGRFTKAS